MNESAILFLLGYPLSIFANLSTDFLKERIKIQDAEPLKTLFVKALLDALNKNRPRVDELGRIAIGRVEKALVSDKESIFAILQSCLGGDPGRVLDIRSDALKKCIADSLCQRFELSRIDVARFVILDCLNEYEKSFFAQMTDKAGMHFLASCLRKLQSDVATRSDIENLKELLIRHLDAEVTSEFVGQEVRDVLRDELANYGRERFSDSIVDYMASLRKKVEKMTADQYQVLHQLRFKRRVAISGCAGSGKTLLAAEKAIRLDQAGIRTLVLCHNPYLAEYLRDLTKGSSVDVFDITTFIEVTLGREMPSNATWNEYVEPSELDIERAFDRLGSSPNVYEAVIVDEGQDFRELWWLIVDAITCRSQAKMLYIFYDDNQTLLPFRTQHPVEGLAVSMTRNCRNGGNIFEIVRRFHPSSPLTSQFLRADGIVRLIPFDDGDLQSNLIKSLQDAFKYVNPPSLAIVTNETVVQESMIANLGFFRRAAVDWRRAVLLDLEASRQQVLSAIEYRRKNRGRMAYGGDEYDLPLDIDPETYFGVPTLSSELFPTEADIETVRRFATRLQGRGAIMKRSRDVFWVEEFGDLRLLRYIAPDNKRLRNPEISEKIRFYSSKNWADKIPTFRGWSKIVPYAPGALLDDDSVPLYSLDMIKGLEAEAVVLFINALNSKDIHKELYVGASRAIGYLAIVINKTVLAKIQRLHDGPTLL